MCCWLVKCATFFNFTKPSWSSVMVKPQHVFYGCHYILGQNVEQHFYWNIFEFKNKKFVLKDGDLPVQDCEEDETDSIATPWFGWRIGIDESDISSEDNLPDLVFFIVLFLLIQTEACLVRGLLNHRWWIASWCTGIIYLRFVSWSMFKFLGSPFSSLPFPTVWSSLVSLILFGFLSWYDTHIGLHTGRYLLVFLCWYLGIRSSPLQSPFDISCCTSISFRFLVWADFCFVLGSIFCSLSWPPPRHCLSLFPSGQCHMRTAKITIADKILFPNFQVLMYISGTTLCLPEVVYRLTENAFTSCSY